MKKGVPPPDLLTLDEVVEDPSLILAFRAGERRVAKNGGRRAAGTSDDYDRLEITPEILQRFVPSKGEVQIDHLPDGGMKVTRVSDGRVWLRDPPVPENSPGQFSTGGGGGGKAGGAKHGEKPAPQWNKQRKHDSGVPGVVLDRLERALEFGVTKFTIKEAGRREELDVVGGGRTTADTKTQKYLALHGKKKGKSAKAIRSKSKKGKKGSKSSEDD